ncbi:MAG: DUF5694 domain-containing protein [Sphingopyxis sp.]
MGARNLWSVMMAFPPHTPLPNSALLAARLCFGGGAPIAMRHSAGRAWAGRAWAGRAWASLCGLVASAVALACVPVAVAAQGAPAQAVGEQLVGEQATPAAITWPEGVPAIDLAAFRADVAGPRTRVATLASQHLGALPANSGITTAMLEPLLGKLAAFAPNIITHEGLSGEQCAVLLDNPAIYPAVFDDYCWDNRAALAAAGLTLAQARAAVETVLAQWPSAPVPHQRRHLASLFLISGDRPSALVQWLQLPPEERRAADGLDGPMVQWLAGAATRLNETYAIAATLAARLGHARVYAVDDHTADAVNLPAPPGYEDAVQATWQSPLSDALRQQDGARMAAVRDGATMLRLYQQINDPAVLRAYIDVDQRAALASAQHGLTRRYVAWWETRNLRMVANIRAAMAAQPGARVLNIVGASHKPYYDAYLAMMPDVAIVDMEAVLR